MKIVASLLTLISMSLSVQAIAGGEGNGGDAVVCRDAAQNIRSIEVLDYYEARVLRQIQIDLGQSGIPDRTYMDNVSSVLTRLYWLDPVRMERYRKQASQFESDSVFLPGVKLTYIPDDGHLFLPTGCQIEQIAIQRSDSEMLPGDKKYLLNRDLWDHLDDVNKAGLILHEIIYREALQNGAQNSIRVRYFNSLLSSTIENLTPKDYYDLVKTVPLSSDSLGGFDKVSSVEFTADGHIKHIKGVGQGELMGTYEIWYFPNGKVQKKVGDFGNYKKKYSEAFPDWLSFSVVVFDEAGKPRELTEAGGAHCISIRDPNITGCQASFKLSANGRIVGAEEPGGDVSVESDKYKVLSYEATFFESGKLKSFSSYYHRSQVLMNGEWIYVKSAEFDEDGNLVKSVKE